MALTREERTGEWIVNKYWSELMIETDDDPSLKQQLLCELLSENSKRLPISEGNPTAFHKAFRTTDVCSSGDEDMLIWVLMTNDKVIWKVLEEFYAN